MMPAKALPVTPSAEATLALLWERVRQQGDMPGFTRAIGAILGAMRGEDDYAFSMTRTVLSDPVLTHKVLRLANSGMYAAFGQRINTVSKAVLVLGTDAIGHLALGLKRMEELSSSATDPSIVHVEMEKAVLAGIVARQVAASARRDDPEEAVVCSMLHTLGRMMVSFYMPERWGALQAHAGTGVEETAALAVLGLPMEEIGRLAAEQWGLPNNLIRGMRRVAPSDGAEALSHEDWLAALSTMSCQCADSLWHDDEAGAVALRALASSYAGMLGIEPDGILGAIDKARDIAACDLSIAPLARLAEKQAQAPAATRRRPDGNKVLLAGVTDMGDVLARASPGQMMSMALETAWQGLSLTRAVAFLRNRRERRYSAKMCFGEQVTELMPLMAFDEAYEPNVFHASLNTDRVIFIENAMDPKFAAKLPSWWDASLGSARSFVVLPLCSGGQPLGFIYGDWDLSFPDISINPTEFALLNDLRALMVKSVERRQRLDLSHTPAR